MQTPAQRCCKGLISRQGTTDDLPYITLAFARSLGLPEGVTPDPQVTPQAQAAAPAHLQAASHQRFLEAAAAAAAQALAEAAALDEAHQQGAQAGAHQEGAQAAAHQQGAQDEAHQEGGAQAAAHQEGAQEQQRASTRAEGSNPRGISYEEFRSIVLEEPSSESSSDGPKGYFYRLAAPRVDADDDDEEEAEEEEQHHHPAAAPVNTDIHDGANWCWCSIMPQEQRSSFATNMPLQHLLLSPLHPTSNTLASTGTYLSMKASSWWPGTYSQQIGVPSTSTTPCNVIAKPSEACTGSPHRMPPTARGLHHALSSPSP
eukprot:54423-Amphidinium_carterae.2